LGIREAADAMVGYVHARDANQEGHLLDIPNRIQDTVELSIHHGADHDGSLEDFGEAADTVVDLVLAEEVVKETTRHLGS
jgi:hypothetical protein